MLLRPKRLTRGQRVRLTEQLHCLERQGYSPKKVLATFLYRGFLPSQLRVPRIAGEVCSTGPATSLRRVGSTLKMPATAGYELAGDYARSPSFKTIGVAGRKYNPTAWRYLGALPRRLALGAGAGGAAYTLGRDVTDEPMAPAAAVLGGTAGLVAGSELEKLLALEASPVQRVRGLPGGRYIAGGPRRSQIIRQLSKNLGKIPLIVPPALMIGGAGIPYLVAKMLYRKRRLEREREDRARDDET
jgi:hypothetical protein